ncbi:DUF1661 domain-containing protein [Porphyromonas gingivalis]|uniref:DUF1661 domain-containing protein n=1 Tax=Porphyromonas gingivalis TaxID=837 RepID=A0AAE9XG43_PORGN|nr:DUF1661 domain-containing protein [Porphyromonas gingivalis]WCG04227.1 DUF1661 domain-containing protein [Porphyromonas gingivalis]
MARKFFTSRAKTKNFTRHILWHYK